MSAAHTPGPWKATHNYGGALEVNGPNEEIVVGGCGCCGSPYGDNLEADARLIAAAPDLLEALRPIAKHGEISAEIIAAARAAIAKATGGAA